MPKATLSTYRGARFKPRFSAPEPELYPNHFSTLSLPYQSQSFKENASASWLIGRSSYVDSSKVPPGLWNSILVSSSIFSQRQRFKVNSSYSQSVLLISFPATLGHQSFSFFDELLINFVNSSFQLIPVTSVYKQS